SIEALVALWLPLLEGILAYVCTRTDAASFSTDISQEPFLDDVSKHVSAMLYAGKAPAATQTPPPVATPKSPT
ncbi:hypothetical protein KKC87_04385, partial [Patescibacteria group bacterium]|nr:hypothetical protein [Patescibacteria group bacterium]